MTQKLTVICEFTWLPQAQLECNLHLFCMEGNYHGLFKGVIMICKAKCIPELAIHSVFACCLFTGVQDLHDMRQNFFLW